MIGVISSRTPMNAPPSTESIVCTDTIDTFLLDSIYLMDRVPNTIISNGYFARILYTLPYATINSIYIALNIPSMRINIGYNNARPTCTFCPEYVPHKWLQLESDILNKVCLTLGRECDGWQASQKTPDLKLTQQLQSGILKLSHKPNINARKMDFQVMLNISGIWESATQYGLMYKFTLCTIADEHPTSIK